MSPYLPYQQPGDVDPPLPSPEVLSRHRARVLDPSDAVLLKGQQIRSTLYVADQLLVSPQSRPEVVHAIREAAGGLGLDAIFAAPPRGGEAAAVLVTLVPRVGTAVQPDAWVVLQRARAAVGRRRGGWREITRWVGPSARRRRPPAAGLEPKEGEYDLEGVGLNHLGSITPGGVIGQWEPHPPPPGGVRSLYGGSTISEYGRPGLGGRTPVLYMGQRPRRRNGLNTRRPVVAVLDMGCAKHEWLPMNGGVVNRTPRLDGTDVGMPGPGLEIPFSDGPMDGGLHWAFGHGTFTCGLVRQTCPDADLVAARVVSPDGMFDEWTLAVALERIYELARRWIDGDPGGLPVDVVSLSLGYYHEQLTDPWAGGAIRAALQKLGLIGVSVVAAAGNDATRRKLFPAAWSEWPPAGDSAPLISVGALNLDGSVALFSNSDDWVRHWERGVALVSSVPHHNGGANASAEAVDPSQQRRRSFDPDYYRGYAIWSGTSFAAPVLAGKLARRLLRNSENPGMSLDEQNRDAAIQRALAAVGHYVRPPTAFGLAELGPLVPVQPGPGPR